MDQTKVQDVKVDVLTAEAEVNRWLDLKRISPKKRKDVFEQNIKNLVSSISAGVISLDFEKKRATVNLQVPLTRKEGKDIETLELRFNMGIKQAFMHAKGVDADDVNERPLSMIAALCDMPLSILKNAKNKDGEEGLDIADFNALRDYALFFLV